jgi:hypothetical protein
MGMRHLEQNRINPEATSSVVSGTKLGTTGVAVAIAGLAEKIRFVRR